VLLGADYAEVALDGGFLAVNAGQVVELHYENGDLGRRNAWHEDR
jgi:hypothetical protein